MRAGYYRSTVIGCAFAWFMVGLHFPMFHEITDHGASVSWPVMAIVTCLIIAAIAGLWVLLRAPAGWTGRGT